MKRNVWIFGLILGTILTGNALYMMNKVCNNPSFEGNDVVGYAAMIVVFSLTFFGIRNYRDKQLNGTISFARAFRVGGLIALVGSTMYVVVGLFYIFVVQPDFLDKYGIHMIKMAEKHGATAEELAAKTIEVEQFKDMYKNPLFAILISYMEVLPVGLAVALVSSLILKRRKNPDATTA